MIGIDYYKRPYIVIKYTYDEESIPKKYNLEVLFQRFRYERNTWTAASKYFKNISCYDYFLNNGNLDIQTKKNIECLLNNDFKARIEFSA